ncbi:MAG: nucleoside monophosphate kinase [Planctomycetaceae bacterium]
MPMPAERYRSVLLYGAPGVGKGTQGRILGTIPGFFHLSSGDVFRSIDVRSPDGKEVSAFMSRGELVPDDLTIRLWRRALDARIATTEYKPHEDLLILDGIPRSVGQSQLLQGHIEALGVIHLVSTDEPKMIERIRRRAIRENRADDANESVIRRRFEIYRQQTAPVIDFYDPGLIAEVDALGSPAEVLRDVLECVIPIQNRIFYGNGRQ